MGFQAGIGRPCLSRGCDLLLGPVPFDFTVVAALAYEEGFLVLFSSS